MKRRSFIKQSSILSSGFIIAGRFEPLNAVALRSGNALQNDLYTLFKSPVSEYRPFVRWWWNGNKIEAGELIRELQLLKDAGIGGVEINPVEFPSRSEGDDLGKPSVKWLSNEWISMLKTVFDEAKKLDLTCDLIVGSGWPFGAETLSPEERAQIVVIAVKRIIGPADYEISDYELFREADPAVSSPFPGRTMELLSLSLVPDPLSDEEQIVSYPVAKDKHTYNIKVPSGKHAVYGLVKINGFMQVINGAPGATGPVLDHYNSPAVAAYLNRMSDSIEAVSGPLSHYLRALFTDSMELEGSNWCRDILAEFRKRRGYDIFTFLPFILFRTGAMGNITDLRYGVSYSESFDSMIRRMRYDFEVTKAELLEERFTKTYTEWCHKLGVRSRAQAYGRGFFPLENSMNYDIPESESWTTNYLKHRPGEEMPEDDYRKGRAYTMINKYVSSAANLSGKKVVSCEEMTDTYTVFNTTLEILKLGGDQSAITGVTHTVFHGFNYSPPEAPWPGWIRYGAWYNENNTWWPWFHFYNEYKTRLSGLLCNVTMYTDIGILPPLDDMWSNIGMQMEPFPSMTHVDYFTLIWEAINKNGNGCDYLSQRIIRHSAAENGWLLFGKRKYHTIFLVQLDSLNPDTALKLLEFVSSGGRIFCVETIPSKSTGWKDHGQNDQIVSETIAKISSFADRFYLIRKPEKNFIEWYKQIQSTHNIKPYLNISNPDPYIMQNRYSGDDRSEFIYIINSNLNNPWSGTITFSPELTRKRYGWVWDPETGNRYRIYPDKDNSMKLELCPVQSVLFAFDSNRTGEKWQPMPASGNNPLLIETGWTAEFIHCREGSQGQEKLGSLCDLKDIPGRSNFAGTVIYRNSFNAERGPARYLNLGKVYGLAELRLNGKFCGVRWYGRRIFDISDYLSEGINEVEVRVVTTMGNYMKSLKDNPVAQYWTNEKNKIQPLQPMGLTGPVTVY
jgi:hypothetical protein